MKIKIQGTQKVIPLACLENTIENYRCVINQHTCTKKRKHAFVNSRGDKIERGVFIKALPGSSTRQENMPPYSM